jgi:hypothetical protein
MGLQIQAKPMGLDLMYVGTPTLFVSLNSLVGTYFQKKPHTCSKIQQTKDETRLHLASFFAARRTWIPQ